jgi:CRISPR-associated protein Csm3
MSLKYLGRLDLTSTIDVISGLHIGAGKDAIEIGGIDNPVVKHPHTGDPYIPGSSLKGKARFLMEWAFNKVRSDGRAFGFNDEDATNAADGGDVILRLFGTAASRDKWQGGPTRLLVRDAPINKEWREQTLRQGRLFTEDKAEVSIDRIAGKALDGGLRHTERVAAGAKFDMEIGLRLWDTGDGGARDCEAVAWFIQALDLIEQDALGGSGSRGYGRVAFHQLRLKGIDGQAPHNLDNLFRGHPFNPHAPPVRLLEIVAQAASGLGEAA